MKHFTVGDLRKAIANLPDEMAVTVWDYKTCTHAPLIEIVFIESRSFDFIESRSLDDTGWPGYMRGRLELRGEP